MGKILVVAEKPSVGRDIAKVLGVRGKGDGYITGDKYIVSWAIGHLITLYEPEDYDAGLKKWKRGALPILPEEIFLKPIADTKKQLSVLKKLMNSKDTDSIVCATDSGREGELIFRYIYSYLKCKKPVNRLWISSMTDEAIKKGFEDIKPSAEYDDLFKSAKCRSEADWLVGINATRAFTLTYDVLLSIGRVQTPTLAIIVDRQREIDNFTVTPYWQVKADFGKYCGLWFKAEDGDNKILVREKAEEIVNKLTGKTGVIKSVEVEKKSQPPEYLYDLTSLQRECNRKFGYSAQTVLNAAQDLYEKYKLITYPRTDSRFLSSDMKPKVLDIVKKLNTEPYSDYAEKILKRAKLPGSRVFNDGKVTDHHAIIPTNKQPDLKALSAYQKNVYDMAARRFLSVFYPHYEYEITKITTEAEDELFLTKGNTVKALGWKELYPTVKDKQGDKDSDDSELPPLSKGEINNIDSLEILSKQTAPPKPYTDGTLLSAMENAGRFIEDEELKESLKDSGLGTPATRASIIERIISVGYVKRQNKSLAPTEKGIKLISIVPDELKSPETTGKWEKGLSSVAKGKLDDRRFMESIGRFVRFLVEKAETADSSVIFEKAEKPTKAKSKGGNKLISLGVCPVCGKGAVYENTKAYYCGDWKMGCKLTIWKDMLKPYGIDITPELIKKLLKDKKYEKINMVLPQTGEKCRADLVIDKEKNPIIQIINLNREMSEVR